MKFLGILASGAVVALTIWLFSQAMTAPVSFTAIPAAPKPASEMWDDNDTKFYNPDAAPVTDETTTPEPVEDFVEAELPERWSVLFPSPGMKLSAAEDGGSYLRAEAPKADVTAAEYWVQAMVANGFVVVEGTPDDADYSVTLQYSNMFTASVGVYEDLSKTVFLING